MSVELYPQTWIMIGVTIGFTIGCIYTSVLTKRYIKNKFGVNAP